MLGTLDFYNQIVLQSMSTLYAQLLFLCDILLDMVIMVCIYLCISCVSVPHLCISVSFTVTRTCESC